MTALTALTSHPANRNGARKIHTSAAHRPSAIQITVPTAIGSRARMMMRWSISTSVRQLQIVAEHFADRRAVARFRRFAQLVFQEVERYFLSSVFADCFDLHPRA